MRINEFRTLVKNAKGKENDFWCSCPNGSNHKNNDIHPSLHVSSGKDGRILLKCRKCSAEEIVSALGLQMADLYPDKGYIDNKPYIKFLESRTGCRYQDKYDFQDKNGKYVFSKFRLVDGSEKKNIQIGVLYTEGQQTRVKLGKPNKSGIFARNLDKASDTIIYCEGEKDCLSVSKMGYAACTFGSSADVNRNITDFLQIFKDKQVFVMLDNDPEGLRVADKLFSNLQTVASEIKFYIPCRDKKGGDISDYLEGHTKRQFEELLETQEITLTEIKNLLEDKADLTVTDSVEVVPESNVDRVKALLDYTYTIGSKIPVIRQTVRNWETVLSEDNRFKNKIRYDEFSRQIFLFGSVPWEMKNNVRAWSTTDDSRVFSIIQTEYGLKSRPDFFDAIKNIAHENRFHQVRDLIKSFTWDKKSRIETVFIDCIGAKDTPYSRAVSRLFIMGGISRIFRPGIKFDYCVILQGPQGCGKSTLLQRLALNDDWFTDSLDSLDATKSAEIINGVWISELAELKSLSRTSNVDSVKAFISRTSDKYRIPYERRADIFPRQCVFAGTTNETDFLTDTSGNRRFLILPVGEEENTVDLFDESCIEYFQQVWAEALYIYQNEEFSLVLPKEFVKEAEEKQVNAMVDDGMTGLVLNYLDTVASDRVCALEIWESEDGLNEKGRPKRYQTRAINSAILSTGEWEAIGSARFGKYGKQRGFQRKKTSTNKEKFVDISDENVPFLDENVPPLLDINYETPW